MVFMTNKLYTYEVFNPRFPDSTDEIDVRAATPAEALVLARAEADDLYGTDSTLTPMNPGGSAGTFTRYSY